MFGAILGDIVGSPYEFDRNNIKTKEFPLFSERSEITDDTVMTLAVAQALMDAGDEDDETLRAALVTNMQKFGRAYPGMGYGARFFRWLMSDTPEPYNSCGNGSAMRVSPVAWRYNTLARVRHVARLTAEVTHDHPEGIKGAEAVAGAILLARAGIGKTEIRDWVEETFGYDLCRTCDEIRPGYYHMETCQETVPEAFAAFLEGESFEDVLRTAVSLGGDSDTLAAIAGSMAEAYYGIDEDWKKAALNRIPEPLRITALYFDAIHCQTAPVGSPVHEAVNFAEAAHRGQKRKGTDIDYIVHPMEVFQILTTMNAGQELLIAGLLHDTVEDTEVTLDQVRETFGDRVATLVASHTVEETGSWQAQRQRTLDSLKTAERDTKLLILADKVSNLRSMYSDHLRLGDALWDRFNAPKELQGWYNRELLRELDDLRRDPDVRSAFREFESLYRKLFMKR